MNVRIGDSDDFVSSVRSGAAVGRTRTAVSDLGGATDGARPHGGVVIRLSAEAQKILARDHDQRDPEDARAARRGDADPDTDVGDATGKGGAPSAAPVAVGRPRSSDASKGAGGDGDEAGGKSGDGGGVGKEGGRASGTPRALSDEDKRVVTELSARDTAVRAHEAAHQAAAGGFGGSASFTYETGPDGKRYAVGGEVPVSIRPGRTPRETIANAQTVRSAAMAPADPSAQDMAVAAQAAQMEAEARQELMASKGNGAAGDGDAASGGTKAAGGGAGGGDSRDGGAEPGAAPATAAPSAGAPTPGAIGAERVAPGRGAGAQPTRGERHAAREPHEGDGRQKAGTAEEKAAPRDVQHDQMMVFSALRAERKTLAGGHQHLASGGGGSCAICSRAAARYA